MGFAPTSESFLLSKVDDYSDIYRLVLARKLTSQSKFSSIGFYIFFEQKVNCSSLLHLEKYLEFNLL